jgi:uncharacterized protein (TIGR03083 family)
MGHDGAVIPSRGTSGTARTLDHLERYADVAGRFAEAIRHADLHAPVAACPGWSALDLVRHVGNIHAWAATIVETGRAAPQQDDRPGSHRPRAVADWYAGKAEDLYRALRAVDPDRPCWTFVDGAATDRDRPAGGTVQFWRRRQLHETTIHGLDLASTLRAADRERLGPGATDAPLAEDGVDEVLRVFLRRMHARGHPAALTAPLVLLASDTGRAWTLTPRPAAPPPVGPVPPQPRGPVGEPTPASAEGPPLVVDRQHPAADRVTAPAAVLYRLLWKRIPVGVAPEDVPGVDVHGDLSRVRAFLGSRLTA